MNTVNGDEEIVAWQLLDSHCERVQRVFEKGLAALREALHADRVAVGPEGEPIFSGPDHPTRITAARLLFDFSAGNRRPSPKGPPPPRRGITLEELRVLIAQNNAKEKAESERQAERKASGQKAPADRRTNNQAHKEVS